MGFCRCCGRCAAVAGAGAALVLALAWQMWPERCCGEHLKLRPAAEEDRGDACALQGNGSLKDLETKGFTVLRGFVPETERQRLLKLRDRQFSAEHKKLKEIGYEYIDQLEVPKIARRLHINELIYSIQKETDIVVLDDRMPESYGIFLTTDSRQNETLMLRWHVDEATFYRTDDSYNFLNFYAILDKPDPLEAGLSVVPYDLLAKRCPELHALSRGTGAKDFDDKYLPGLPPGWMVMKQQERDRLYIMEFHLDDLSCTPRLEAGDVLVFRGDTIHRTQPFHSVGAFRTALSYRISPRPTFSVQRFLQGGFRKYTSLMASDSAAMATDLSMQGGDVDLAMWRLELTKTRFSLQIKAGFFYRLALVPVRAFIGRVLDEPPWLYAFFGTVPHYGPPISSSEGR